MKHKLTVLACVGLALLLSTGFAFAQSNTITIESKNVNRCSNATVGINLINGGAVGCIGLPLKVTGGTVTAAVATARLAGWELAQNGLPGASFILNAVGCDVQIPQGAGNIYTLTVPIPSACTGTIEIDTAFFPPAGAVILLPSLLPFVFNKGVLTLDDQAPICGTNLPVTSDWKTPIVDKLLLATDPDACDALTYTLVSSPGSITLGTNKYSWDPECTDVATSPHTITFKATDPCGEFATCTFQVTWTQEGPVCEQVLPQTVHFAGTLNVLLPATDDGCPAPLQWTLLLPEDLEGAVGIGKFTGLLTYVGNCDDVATSPHTVTYKVSDGVKECVKSVQITVTNTAPVIYCPAELVQRCDTCGGPFTLGLPITGTATDFDADGDPLTYATLPSWTLHNGVAALPHNAPVIGANGEWSWIPYPGDTTEVGTWIFTLTVFDGCALDTCSFLLEVEFEYILGIRDVNGLTDKVCVLNGEIADVYVNLSPGPELGGFDILLAYDKTGLTFVAGPHSPERMDGLIGWEYFTYRTSANSNCSGPCPSGLLRLIAIADLDNGPLNHPSDFNLVGNFIRLQFLVSSDRNLIGQCLPISFYWLDCGDNGLASKDGEILYVPFGTDVEACMEHAKDTCALLPVIHLDDGAICVCEPIDDRGDINQNGIANEVADAVLFSNVFIYGVNETFPIEARRAAQILATDINDDGIVLTVADLVYLIRIITGDAQPFPANPKLTPYQGQANAIVNVGADRVSVTTSSSVDLGGVVFTFRYSGLTVGDVVLSDAASQMVVKSRADRGELRVLVAPAMNVKGARVNAGINEILSIPTSGQGTIELTNVEMSDAQGALLSTSFSKSVPAEYALLQNYPNPFNAGTVIQFSLKEGTDWKLNVYNITGQMIRSFSGNGQGQVQVAWDGSDNAGNAIASGVYFYRLDTKSFTATKKMTLLK